MTAVVGGGAMACALSGFAWALRERDRGRMLTAVWVFLGAFHVALLPGVLKAIAEPLTARTLVHRIESALPAGASLSVCGIDPDPTLPLLFYARDPETIAVRAGGPCLERAEPGFHLMSQTEWQRGSWMKEPDRWRAIFHDEIRGWKRRTAVVFAERVAAEERSR